MEHTYLDQNMAKVRAHLSESCRAAGRDPAGVTLMAAVKSADAAEIDYIHKVLGVTDIGENRVQQLLERYDVIDRAGLNIHFIGTLQTNKVKYIIDKVAMIQSLDSEHLAKEIEKQAAKVGRVMDVLIEINSGHEESKSGIAPEGAAELAAAVVSGAYPHIRLRGFMTMAPKGSDEDYHRYFGETRRLCEALWAELPMHEEKMILSMGMSDSYPIAAEEGATLVRVGRTLFRKEEEPTL